MPRAGTPHSTRLLSWTLSLLLLLSMCPTAALAAPQEPEEESTAGTDVATDQDSAANQVSPVEGDDIKQEPPSEDDSGDAEAVPADENITVFRADMVTTAETDDDYTYILMNIPYGEFYAAEKDQPERLGCQRIEIEVR